MFSGIHHIGYLTESNAEAIEFYVKTFGARVVREATGSDGKTPLAYVQVGDTEIELVESPERVRTANRGSILLDHVGYFVPDVEDAIAELRTRGVKFAGEHATVNPQGYKVLYTDQESTRGVKMHLTEK